MKLTNVIIPKTWYDINQYNNTITVSFNYTLVSTNTIQSYDIIIPEGNYTGDELCLMFENILINIPIQIIPADVSSLLKMKYNKQLGKMFFYMIGSSNANINIISYTLEFKENINGIFKNNNHFGNVIGFKQVKYVVNKLIDNQLNEKTYIYSINDIELGTPSQLQMYLEGEYKYNIANKINYVFVQIDDYLKNSTTDVINSFSANYKQQQIMCDTKCNGIDETQTTYRTKIGYNYLNKNILGCVNVNNIVDNIIYSDKTNSILKSREYFGPVKIEKFNISLIDRYGNKINDKNNMFSCILEFEQIY
jgi:hypothetical protein